MKCPHKNLNHPFILLNLCWNLIQLYWPVLPIIVKQFLKRFMHDLLGCFACSEVLFELQWSVSLCRIRKYMEMSDFAPYGVNIYQILLNMEYLSYRFWDGKKFLLINVLIWYERNRFAISTSRYFTENI